MSSTSDRAGSFAYGAVSLRNGDSRARVSCARGSMIRDQPVVGRATGLRSARNSRRLKLGEFGDRGGKRGGEKESFVEHSQDAAATNWRRAWSRAERLSFCFPSSSLLSVVRDKHADPGWFRKSSFRGTRAMPGTDQSNPAYSASSAPVALLPIVLGH